MKSKTERCCCGSPMTRVCSRWLQRVLNEGSLGKNTATNRSPIPRLTESARFRSPAGADEFEAIIRILQTQNVAADSRRKENDEYE